VASETEIAVVGAACRLPDARNPRQFWRNIDHGLVSMRELTDEQLRAAGVSDEEQRAQDFVPVGTTLPGVADFAADFFGYSPREAELIDPQQRLFLEVCWEALEAAAHPPRPDGPVVGVFAGSAAGNYSAAVFAARARELGLVEAIADLELTMGSQADFLAARVAYKLGLRGPSVGVQTACSSGLTAVHYASLSLLAGECDLALAGGATVLEPLRGYRYRPGRAESADGYCRSFDARSTGTNFSSGVVVVALRRLADALADRDPVLAVLPGSAVGNDGSDRLGFTAPGPPGVAGVVAAALRVAGVPADQLRYVEAHGTGTPVGDRIELQGLIAALRETTDRVGFCGLGSAMANIGHTGPAAGVAGLLKVIHAVRAGSLPPHPMFERARDPGVLADSPFVISTAAEVCTDPDRHMLVNSIGMGGSNAAVVVAPPPDRATPPGEGGGRAAREASPPATVRLVLSARTRTELDAMSRALADELETGAAAVSDVAHTLRVGRQRFAERRVVAAAPDRLAAALRLPRPPAARTARPAPRPAVVVLPDGPDGMAAPPDLLAALPAGTEVVRHPAAVPDGRYPVELATGVDVEEALATAWLNGVEVDWAALADGRGHRVALPTYPFTRKRYWALDRLQPPAAQPAHAPPQSAEDEVTLAAWRELFGIDSIGPDDEFGALGGTSLQSVQLVLAIQQRCGVLVNFHRAGGSRATARRVAEAVRRTRRDPAQAEPAMDRMDHADDDLVDADVRLPLGPLAATEAPGRDVLLTGATGYLGAFVLHELLRAGHDRVYCVIRAGDEAEGWQRIRAAAAGHELPAPDPTRVRVVPGDLRELASVADRYRDGELARRVGHVLHCAARVVFTEPYRDIRVHNVQTLAELLRWARGHGVRDFSLVSSMDAAAPGMGADQRLLELREQALEPLAGGYGVTKWVGERLLERVEQDGMRVRVFRPGLLLAATGTGACNANDLIWATLVSGLAVGAHPLDDRLLTLSPVDVVARAIVGLAFTPGSVGRPYHLVSEQPYSLRRLFELLGQAGLPTRPIPLRAWRERVRERALATGNPALSTTALLEIEGHEHGAEAVAWRPWLRSQGLDPEVTGGMLRRGVEFLVERHPPVGDLLAGVVRRDGAEVGS
jgi:thioester reductase-like protein